MSVVVGVALLVLTAADNPAALVGLLTFAGVAVTAGTSYLISRRLNRGDIRMSSAESLWQAQESLRHDLERALSASLEREATLRERVATLEAQVDALRRGQST